MIPQAENKIGNFPKQARVSVMKSASVSAVRATMKCDIFLWSKARYKRTSCC